MTYHCFSDKKLIARKPHRCVWCARAVLVGSSYRLEHSVYFGRFQNFAWHEACRFDADKWFAEMGEGEVSSDNEMSWHALYLLEASALSVSSAAPEAVLPTRCDSEVSSVPEGSCRASELPS
jgi:hypothetical protein